MKESEVVILGSGHLAVRLKRKLEKNGIPVNHIAAERFLGAETDEKHSRLESVERILSDIGLENASAACVMDDQDDRNIGLALSIIALHPDLPVFVSLYNDSVGSRFKGIHPSLRVIDPATTAATVLSDRLRSGKGNAPSENLRGLTLNDIREKTLLFSDKLLLGVFLSFLVFFLIGVVIFREAQNLSWVDALYFATVTVSTVGYGDITFLHSTPGMKLFNTLFILGSMVFVSVFFALLIDRMSEKRYQIELGRRKYRLKGHVIVCGLGRMGYGLSMELLGRGEKVLIIESDPDNRYLGIVRSRGAKTLVGDAKLVKNLTDAGVKQAAGVFVVIDNDILNLEIGMNALSLNPEVPTVLRIFDEEFAERVSTRLGIPFTFSMTSIVADHLVGLISGSDMNREGESDESFYA